MSINILLADDSVPAQNMGKKILTDAGYSVVTVNNGLEALRKIAEAAPDVAILDIFMPGYTGLEICKRLRASAATAAIPVVLTVGKMEPYRPEDGEQVHSNAVIVKPFAAAELISAVRSLIGAPHPESSEPGVGQPAKTDAKDPLEQGYPAAESVAFAPSAADEAAAPELRTEASAEEEADEPLFLNALSEDGGDMAASAPPEPSVYGEEEFRSGQERDEVQSLAFDPDARHAPFSASAVDSLPTVAHSDAGQEAAAFTEFDLEAESSLYEPMPVPGESTVDGPLLAALAAFGQAGVLDGATSVSEPMVSAPESLVEQDDPSGAAELELSGLNVPALDPLLEVQEAPNLPSTLESSGPETDEASNQIFSDFTAENVAPAEEDSSSLATPLSAEEEARRAAFEELFNSDEEMPLEENPTSYSSGAIEVLPNLSDLSQDHARDVEPDAELEVLGVDSVPHFVDPGPDPKLVESGQPEEEALGTIGIIPDRDPLLVDAPMQAGWEETGSVPLPDDDLTVLMPTTAAEAAAADALPEVDLEEPPSEIPQETVEAALELPPIQPEATAAEAQPVEPEPERSDVESDLAIAALASLAAEAAFLHAKPAAPPAEDVPERVEVLPIPASAATEEQPAVVEAPAETAPLRPEQAADADIFAPGVPVRSNEAERVHQAVERVFERFKPLLIAAIVRELARSD